MLRIVLLFVYVCLHTSANVPHIAARIIGSPLSRPNIILRDQSSLSTICFFNLRGGSTADTSSMSDSSYDDSEALSGYGFDANEGEEYGDPLEYNNGPYGDIKNREKSSGRYADRQFFMPSSVQLFVTFGCMMMSNRLDLFNPTFVRLVRFAFVVQILIQQFFVLYVHLVAKRTGDTSKVDERNPAVDMIVSQLQLDGNAQEMAKKIASSFLSSDVTATEYDMKHASDMQGGLVVNMLSMWILHFKLEKIQPLLIQVLMGFLRLVYSPLFQVYVLGRNIRRPFKNPNAAARHSMSDSVVVTPVEKVIQEYTD